MLFWISRFACEFRHERKIEMKSRWTVLLLNCLLLMGNYYAYDNPAALSTLLQSHLSQLPKNEFDYTLGLFYSVYSVPNIIL